MRGSLRHQAVLSVTEVGRDGRRIPRTTDGVLRLSRGRTLNDSERTHLFMLIHHTIGSNTRIDVVNSPYRLGIVLNFIVWIEVFGLDLIACSTH